MKLTLVDTDTATSAALKVAFAPFSEVSVFNTDLLLLAENTIVSPANSQGFMDGGIDAAYSAAIPDVEDRVREAIARREEGHLPLGAAVIVSVTHPRIQYVIATTTMLMPEAVDSTHAYRSMRAMLRVAGAHPDRVRSVYCPGLCTGIGRVSPEEAAEAMAKAYGDWKRAQ